MATAREENPYGKFRGCETTPYDRPTTALRNLNRKKVWLTKIVDSAQRLKASSSRKLFSCGFRKRLPPPPTPTPSPLSSDSTRTQAVVREIEERLENRISERLELRLAELASSLQKILGDSIRQSIEELLHNNVDEEGSSMNNHTKQGDRNFKSDRHRNPEAEQEVRDNHQEAAVLVANDSSCKQQGVIVESDAQINISDGGGLADLEKLLKQKTFTREQIVHLTALMHSRTVDSAVNEEGKKKEVVLSDPESPRDQRNEYLKMPVLENGIQNRAVLNPYVTTSAPIEDVASPAELAKAYMGFEDYLELDDDAYPNGAVSLFPLSGKETTDSTALADKITSSTEAIVQKSPGSSVVMSSNSFAVHGKPHSGTVDGEKVDVPASKTSSIPDHTLKPVTVAVTAPTQTVVSSNKSAPPNGSVANPPLFNFGNKVVPSAELTASNSPSKESTKSGPVVGLEKVVSSKEPGADAPLVNLGINKNVDNVPQVPFTFSSSVGGEINGVKFSAASDLKLKSSISSSTVAGAVDSIPKVLQSDNADAKTNTVTEFFTRASELAVSSAALTPLSTSTTNIFNFGNCSNQKGPASLSPSFSSPFPSRVTNNSTSQNMFSSSSLAASSSSYISDTAASTSTSMTTSTPDVIASSNSSSSTPAVASSSSTPSFFKFGSTPVPSTGVPVSSTSGLEPVETKKRDAGIDILGGTSFGSSSAATGSTGSGIFGFSSSAMTTVNSQSQGSFFGTSSGSVSGAMAPSATSGFTSLTHSQLVAFGSSASSPLLGFTENSTFSPGSSSFPSSNLATNIFNSGTTFGQSTIASSSEANSVSSNSQQTAPFGFSFTSSSSSSSGFFFGASTLSVSSTTSPMMFGSTTSASSSPQFSFTSGAATSNMLQPAFGNPSPVLAFGSPLVNNDQMGTEYTMAEDTVQATPSVTPVFGQQPAPLQSKFVFGAPTPTGASPFQFACQQNIAPPKPSPFQPHGSREFNSEGSFSLGSGGADKSGRRIVRVKKK